jgi:hypothetical protein
MAWHKKGWVTIRYRFRDGDTQLTRSFTETSPDRCAALARNWARDLGYEFVGPG